LLHELVRKVGGVLRFGLHGLHREHGHALALRVGLLQPVVEPLAAQHEDEPVLSHGLHEHFDARKLHLRHALGQLHANVGGDAAGAAVRDVAGRVDGAEVASRRDIAVLQVEVDSQRFEYAAADLVLQGIVAEEGDMTRTGAGSDAVTNRQRHAADRVRSKSVEVGRVGGLELALARLGVRQAAQTIDDAEEDLRVAGGGKLSEQFGVHKAILRLAPALLQRCGHGFAYGHGTGSGQLRVSPARTSR
jgi:hypothetical protein